MIFSDINMEFLPNIIVRCYRISLVLALSHWHTCSSKSMWRDDPFTSPDMAICHRRETHFCVFVLEDVTVISRWTALQIGMKQGWQHSFTNPKSKNVKVNITGILPRIVTVAQVRKQALIVPWGMRLKKKKSFLVRVTCHGKWLLVYGLSAVSGDFRSQMRVAWPRSGFTII